MSPSEGTTPACYSEHGKKLSTHLVNYYWKRSDIRTGYSARPPPVHSNADRYNPEREPYARGA
jgi:hypothetical protein